MRLKVAIVIGILLIPTRVLADSPTPTLEAEVLPMPTTHLWMRSGPGVLRGPNGKSYVIPQDSRILTGERWAEQDVEMLRLQEQETRLGAENKSLRDTVNDMPWTVIAIVGVVGMLSGAYLGHKIAAKF